VCVCVYVNEMIYIHAYILKMLYTKRNRNTHTSEMTHTHTSEWLGSQSFLRRLGSQSFHWLSDFCSYTAFSKCIREYKSFHSRIHSSTQAWVSLRQIPVISLVCVCVYVWEIIYVHVYTVNLCTRIYRNNLCTRIYSMRNNHLCTRIYRNNLCTRT